MEIIRYTPDRCSEWNLLVDASANGTFLFRREYMEYHADRFEDASLLVYDGHALVAVLPANRQGDLFCSHGGLTYGGIVVLPKTSALQVLAIFEAVAAWLRSEGFSRWIYKCVPHIYHRYPAETDRYALFRMGASLIARNLSSAIPIDRRIRFNELRRRCIRKAERSGLSISETDDYSAFWGVLTENLQSRYGVSPVHTSAEMKLLHERFPDRIRLFTATRGGEVLAGCVVYDTGRTVHVQYISASVSGKAAGALDLLFSHLISEEFADRVWFEFGQSTEEMGHYLNEGLIAQKEGFGARGVVYDIYELAL